MSYRRASSAQVRCFRPALEILEDRIVPSGIGDQLVNFGKGLVNSAVGLAQVAAVNKDVLLFDLNPTPSNLIPLWVDAVKLTQTVQALNVNVQTFTSYVQEAEAADAKLTQYGLPPLIFTPPTKSLVDGIVGQAQSTLAFFQSAADDAMGDVIAALFTLVGQRTAKPTPIPTAPAPTTTPSTTGAYAIDYHDAPATASASGPNITDSVYVTQSPDSNAPLSVQIKYTANDGTTGDSGIIQIAPGTSKTVSLTVMPCPAGTTGTWQIYIDGQLAHQNNTVFTQ